MADLIPKKNWDISLGRVIEVLNKMMVSGEYTGHHFEAKTIVAALRDAIKINASMDALTEKTRDERLAQLVEENTKLKALLEEKEDIDTMCGIADRAAEEVTEFQNVEVAELESSQNGTAPHG